MKNKQQLFVMSSFQETLNVVTELVWVYFVVDFVIRTLARDDITEEIRLRISIIALAVVIHAPCSVNVHLRRAMNVVTSPNSFAGRLDQFSILSTYIAYTYVTTESRYYGATCTMFLIRPLAGFWEPASTINTRIVYIATGTMMYLFPLVIRHSFRTSPAIIWLSAGTGLFIGNKYANGYGHSLFHLTMLPYHVELLKLMI